MMEALFAGIALSSIGSLRDLEQLSRGCANTSGVEKSGVDLGSGFEARGEFGR